jgi:DNA-binding NarL/FixJ family response regulator
MAECAPGGPMTPSALILIADRYLLDSQLLERRLGRDLAVASCRPDALGSADLAGPALVLVDAALDHATFAQVSARAACLGLLYDQVDTLVRERAATPTVRLVASRLDGLETLVTAVADVVRGADRSAVPVQRPTSGRPDLSRREREVLTLMAKGLANRDIADQLSISPHTVRTHVQALLTKLDRGNRVSAVGAARAAGLLST